MSQHVCFWLHIPTSPAWPVLRSPPSVKNKSLPSGLWVTSDLSFQLNRKRAPISVGVFSSFKSLSLQAEKTLSSFTPVIQSPSPRLTDEHLSLFHRSITKCIFQKSAPPLSLCPSEAPPQNFHDSWLRDFLILHIEQIYVCLTFSCCNSHKWHFLQWNVVLKCGANSSYLLFRQLSVDRRRNVLAFPEELQHVSIKCSEYKNHWMLNATEKHICFSTDFFLFRFTPNIAFQITLNQSCRDLCPCLHACKATQEALRPHYLHGGSASLVWQQVTRPTCQDPPRSLRLNEPH